LTRDDSLEAMLATTVSRPPTGPAWSWEIKWDGLRAFAIVDADRMTLRSRKGTDMTPWFPELSVLGEYVRARYAILDGEIILRDGSPESFNTLLARVRSRGRRVDDEPATFVVFDVLAIDDDATAYLPLDERRLALQGIVVETPRLVVSRVFDDGEALYALAVENGLEGVVGKKRTAPYVGGRSREWCKVKVPGAAARHAWNGAARTV
jgi:bifunctional non-homologous end joining protein LigD